VKSVLFSCDGILSGLSVKYMKKFSGKVLRKKSCLEYQWRTFCRHAAAMSSITRTWFELWLDHSGSMTATDLCRHLAAGCPSFYLYPRYTIHEGFPEFVVRIDRNFRERAWVVCCMYWRRNVFSYYIARFKFKDI